MHHNPCCIPYDKQQQASRQSFEARRHCSVGHVHTILNHAVAPPVMQDLSHPTYYGSHAQRGGWRCAWGNPDGGEEHTCTARCTWNHQRDIMLLRAYAMKTPNGTSPTNTTSIISPCNHVRYRRCALAARAAAEPPRCSRCLPPELAAAAPECRLPHALPLLPARTQVGVRHVRGF